MAFYGCKPVTLEILCPITIKYDWELDISETKTLILGNGIRKFPEGFFDNCKKLEAIFVPEKKTNYYNSRIPENLHHLIKELPSEK